MDYSGCPAGYYCVQSSYKLTDLAIFAVGLGVFFLCAVIAIYLLGRIGR